MTVTFPYIVFAVAFAPEPMFSHVGRHMDLTYGLYLYGFFVQQLVVTWEKDSGVSWGPVVCLLLSIGITALIAMLNCVLIEKPVIRCSHWITDWWYQQEKARNGKTGNEKNDQVEGTVE